MGVRHAATGNDSIRSDSPSTPHPSQLLIYRLVSDAALREDVGPSDDYCASLANDLAFWLDASQHLSFAADSRESWQPPRNSGAVARRQASPNKVLFYLSGLSCSIKEDPKRGTSARDSF